MSLERAETCHFVRRRGAAWSACLAAAFALLGMGCVVGDDLAANGGMSGTGISQGPITGFGSIWVTDVQWTIVGAGVVLDGNAGSAADLRRGMVVRVVGTIAPDGRTGVATSVEFDDAIEGPIDAAPVVTMPGIKEFTIFGVTVVAEDGVTEFDDGASFANLAAGRFVEVSGPIDDAGAIVATRIALRPLGSSDAELRGTIANLDTTTGTFDLGVVTVTYDPLPFGTVFKDGLTDFRDLANGQFVEVEGTVTGANMIDADEIGLEDDVLGVDDADEVKLRGFVSNFVSLAQFQVSGIPVNASTATLDPPGLAVSDGLFVEVEGELVSGTLRAEEVQREELDDEDSEVQIEAAVPTGGVMLPSQLTLLGLTVQTDGATHFEDDRDLIDPFGLVNVADGDWLEVNGNGVGGVMVRALDVEREPLDGDVLLQGPVTAFDAGAGTLSILNRPITNTNGVTVYMDANGNTISQMVFFQGVALGGIVRAVDLSAADPAVLGFADELSLED